MAAGAMTPQELEAIFTKEVRGEIALAATKAMTRAADIFKNDARADIAKAGFSTRWQNALRVTVYPAGRNSLSPAMYAYHNIWYSGIFEDGGTIRAKKNRMWIPLPTVPKKGNRRLSPRQLRVKLSTVNRPGKNPLLVGKLKGTSKKVPLYVGVQSVCARR